MTCVFIIFTCNVSLYKQTQNPQKHMFVIIVIKAFLFFLWFSCDKFIWRNNHCTTWTINGIAINLIVVYGDLLFHMHHLHSNRIRTVGNNLANHILINLILPRYDSIELFQWFPSFSPWIQKDTRKFPEDLWIFFCNWYSEVY
jgi:hypothetical protein